MDRKKIRRIVIAVSCVFLISLLLFAFVKITDPTIRKWQKKTDRLVILYEPTGMVFGDKSPKIEISNRSEIDSWLDLIQTMPRIGFPTFCKCTGNPWLRLYESNKLIAEISIHHGCEIRCDQLTSGNVTLWPDKHRLLMQKCASVGIESYRSGLTDPQTGSN